MKSYDRQFLIENIRNFAAGTVVVWALSLVLSLLQGSDVFLGAAVGLADLGQLVLLLTPQVLARTVPLAMLLAVLMSVGRAIDDGELMAWSGLGRSPFRILRSPFILAAGTSACLIALGSEVQPRAIVALREFSNQVIRRNVATEIKPGLFYQGLPQVMIYAQTVNDSTHWNNVLVFDGRSAETPIFLWAKKNEVQLSPVDHALAFHFSDGMVHRTEPGAAYSLASFHEATWQMGVADQFARKNRYLSDQDEQTLTQLWTVGEDAEMRLKQRLAFYSRMGNMLAPLALLWVAIVLLAVPRSGKGRARVILMAVAAYAAYYLLSRVSVAWGERQWISPFWAGQGVNFLFVALGLATVLLRRHKEAL